MLKSLLAGLSLPSRDGRADRGLDEEGEGEWGPRRFCREGATGLAALGTIVVSLWCTPAIAGLGAALAVRSRFVRQVRGSGEKSTVSRASLSGLMVPAHSWSTHCVPGIVLGPGASGHVFQSRGIAGAAWQGRPLLTGGLWSLGVERWQAAPLGWTSPQALGGRCSRVGCLCLQPDSQTSWLLEESSTGSLPLVSVSLFTPLTAAEMAPYMKRLSRGQTVEGEFGSLAPAGQVGPVVGGGLLW